DGIRDATVTGVQTCALPISLVCARAGPLLGLVRSPAVLFALAPGRGGASAHRAARHATAARALGQPLEPVGRLVDRLEVALVLEIGRASCRERVGGSI